MVGIVFGFLNSISIEEAIQPTFVEWLIDLIVVVAALFRQAWMWEQ